PSSTSLASSWLWWTTSYSPPSCGYSLPSVLKQCGQLATILVAPTSLSVSTFCCASIWKTYSMPSRRAGSPVQASMPPSTANLTPAMCSSSAMALVVFLARSSRAPAQPTQNRYSVPSGSLSSTTGTSKSTSEIQSRRLSSAIPHGLPLFSRFFSRVLASEGKLDSIITW